MTGPGQGCLCSPLLPPALTLEGRIGAIRQEKKDIQIEKEVQLFLITGDAVIYGESPTESTIETGVNKSAQGHRI